MATTIRRNRRAARVRGRGTSTPGQAQKAPTWVSGLRVQQFADKLFHAFNTPFSTRLDYLALSGDWDAVVRSTVQADNYSDPLDFYLDYQASKLVSKNPLLPTGIDVRMAAEKKFIEAEVSCLKTNARLREPACGDYPALNRILHAAQRKIADILGDVPELEDLDLAFGPGAAFGVRKDTTTYHKLTAPLESTHSMIDLLPGLLSEVPGWVSADKADVQLVYGSDLTFVPKDATTDRAICIEPLLNGFLQKGIGTFIRRRLRKHGVNLDDQSINQRLATLAVTHDLATVDFSSASDTISYNLVWDLLPPDWCVLLDAARCPRYRYQGNWYNFQKFSSMGNAYTFELETLIFYSLAYASSVECGIQPLTGRNLHVYGDDVIIPRGAYDAFSSVSTYCGFSINERKSFKRGLFFESCGTDVFLGLLVTPLRLKRGLSTPSDLIYAANLVVRIICRIGDLSNATQLASTVHKTRLARLADLHRWVVSFIPKHRMVLGPFSASDDWLIAPFDRVCPSQGTFGWRHRRLVSRPVKYIPTDGLWPTAYALYSAYRLVNDSLWEGSAPVLWSQGASLRSAVKTSVGSAWSSDWHYPPQLVGSTIWQGY